MRAIVAHSVLNPKIVASQLLREAGLLRTVSPFHPSMLSHTHIHTWLVRAHLIWSARCRACEVLESSSRCRMKSRSSTNPPPHRTLGKYYACCLCSRASSRGAVVELMCCDVSVECDGGGEEKKGSGDEGRCRGRRGNRSCGGARTASAAAGFRPPPHHERLHASHSSSTISPSR